MIKKPKRLAYLLEYDLNKLLDIMNNVDDFYCEFKQIKCNSDGSPKIKNGKINYRIIHPSKGKLKKVQNRINNSVLSKIELPDYVHGGVKGRSNITNAYSHLGKKFHFLTDIEDYFPSISYKLIYKMFVGLSFSSDVSRILTRLTTFCGFLPQGAPTSTHIANLVFLRTDAEVNNYCQSKDMVYTRFVDDISISSTCDFKGSQSEITDILKSSKFKMSNKKTCYKIGPAIITGIDVRNNYLKASPEILAKLQDDSLGKMNRQGLENYVKQIEITN